MTLGVGGPWWRRIVVFLNCCLLSVAIAAPASSADGPSQAQRQVTVGVPKSFPPYYQLDEDGNPSGFAVAVMNEVARRAGFKVTYRVAINGGANFKAIRAGDIDIIPSLGINDYRKQYVGFTQPVDTFRIVLFVRDDTQGVTSIDDMIGRPVAVVVDNVGYRFLEKRTDISLKVFPSFSDALFALLSAKVDGFVYPEPVTWKLAREAGVSDHIKVAAKPLFETKRALAVRKDNTELLTVLDQAVGDFIASPEYQQVYVAWFGKPDPFWSVVRVGWAMGASLAVILIIMGWWRYHSVVQLNQALRESEERYAFAVSGTSDGLWDWNIRTGEDYLSPRWKEILGYEDHELENRMEKFTGALHPDDHDRVMEAVRAHLEERVPYDLEYRLRCKDGSYVWVQAKGQAIWDEDGKPVRMAGSISDITERKQADAHIRRMAGAVEHLSEIFALYDADDRLVMCNIGFRELNRLVAEATKPGVSYEEHLRATVKKGLVPQALGREDDWIQERLERHRKPGEAFEILRQDGQWFLVREQRLPDGATATIGIEITALKQAESAAAEKSALLETTLENMAQGLVVIGADLKLAAFNQRYIELRGYPRGFIRLGMPLEKIVRFNAERGEYGPGDVEERVRERISLIRLGEEVRYERAGVDGRIVAFRREPMPGGGSVTTFTDVTERKRAEQEVAEKSALLETTFESMSQGLSVYDADLKLVAFNEKYVDLTCFPEGFIRLGMPFEEIARVRAQRGDYGPGEVEELAKRFVNRMREAKALQIKFTAPDGSVFEHHRDPMPGGGVINTFTDITERKRAEEALRESEEHLRQAQKMKAVGQLTGGVAHDFNNLLAIIQGSLDLINERVQPDRTTQKLVDAALRATTRGADLTQQLLAFSRQQPLNPESTELNGLIEQMVELLGRTLTETIALETSFAKDLWKTSVDRGQLETAILNLAINARDAMPEGGRLTIETANIALDEDYAKRHEEVRPGPYVMLAISDTGTGMAPEVVDKAFEPFFTTKEPGAGTGLGLSMVYGFARQSGGHAEIYSEPERGTTVKIYLPKGAAAEVATEHHEAVTPTADGGSETILLVEDDPDVRESTRNVIESLGYTVETASDGREALAKLDDTPDVALLLTDIVLPGGMSGVELAKEARNRHPGIRALYMSGYTSIPAIHNDVLKPGVNFIPKPFRMTAIDRAVRRVLDREEA